MLLIRTRWLVAYSLVQMKLSVRQKTKNNNQQSVVRLLAYIISLLSPAVVCSTSDLFLDRLRFFTEFRKRSFNYLAHTVWDGLAYLLTKNFPPIDILYAF